MVDKYQFKVLKNKREYEETSKLFVNCVKSYFDNESDIVIAMVDGEPFACAEVTRKGIPQLLGPHNHKLEKKDFDFIKKIIWDATK